MRLTRIRKAYESLEDMPSVYSVGRGVVCRSDNVPHYSDIAAVQSSMQGVVNLMTGKIADFVYRHLRRFESFEWVIPYRVQDEQSQTQFFTQAEQYLYTLEKFSLQQNKPFDPNHLQNISYPMGDVRWFYYFFDKRVPWNFKKLSINAHPNELFLPAIRRQTWLRNELNYHNIKYTFDLSSLLMSFDTCMSDLRASAADCAPNQSVDLEAAINLCKKVMVFSDRCRENIECITRDRLFFSKVVSDVYESGYSPDEAWVLPCAANETRYTLIDFDAQRLVFCVEDTDNVLQVRDALHHGLSTYNTHYLNAVINGLLLSFLYIGLFSLYMVVCEKLLEYVLRSIRYLVVKNNFPNDDLPLIRQYVCYSTRFLAILFFSIQFDAMHVPVLCFMLVEAVMRYWQQKITTQSNTVVDVFLTIEPSNVYFNITFLMQMIGLFYTPSQYLVVAGSFTVSSSATFFARKLFEYGERVYFTSAQESEDTSENKVSFFRGR